MTGPVPGEVAAGRGHAAARFRKMAMVGVAVAAAGLLAATGFAFLSTNSSASTTVTAGGIAGANNEFADVTTSSIPSGINSTSTWFASGATTPTTQNLWTPVVGQVGSVTTPGDIAMVDTTGQSSGDVLITLVLANAAALDQDYAYMNLPITIWSCAAGASCLGGTSPSGWTSVTADANSNTIGNNGTSYLTLSNGYLSFLLPADAVYEFAIPKGGSFFTISSNTTTGSLSPSYLVNVQSAG